MVDGENTRGNFGSNANSDSNSGGKDKKAAASKFASKSVAKSASKPASQLKPKPNLKSNSKSVAKSTPKFIPKSTPKSALKSASKPTPKSALKPASKKVSAVKSTLNPIVKSTLNPIVKSSQKPAQKSAQKSPLKLSQKPAQKPAAKSTSKPTSKPAKRNAPKASPELSPEIRAEFDEQWLRVRSRMRGELGDSTFNSWFKHLRVHYFTRGRLTLEVPEHFIQEWIEANYLKRLLGHWRAENSHVRRIAMRKQTDWTPPDRKPTIRIQKVMPARALGRNVGGRPDLLSEQARQATLAGGAAHEAAGAPLNKHSTFENFVTGASNELACANAKRLAQIIVADSDRGDGEDSNKDKGEKYSDQNFNPFFLYGGVGLGKTHLMHAVAWDIKRKNPDFKVLYLSAEKFMYQFIRALRFKDTIAFKQQFREVDVLMVDDIQFIADKKSTQEEFFHTFNTLLDHNRPVIITSDRAPNELKGIDERIRSRLGGGMVVDIRPTDYELRLNILQAKADNFTVQGRKTHIPREVLTFLAQRITSNVRELEGALNRVVTYATFSGEVINHDMVLDVLRDLLRAAERRVSIDEIQRRVADYYRIHIADMVSARRTRVVARPRQIAMYLTKELTPRSFPEIGRKFGNRDHSTVIHAVRRIKELRETDPTLDEEVDLLAKMLIH